jgi:hypothetical protein
MPTAMNSPRSAPPARTLLPSTPRRRPRGAARAARPPSPGRRQTSEPLRAEALRHWRAYLSARDGSLEDQEEFFTELGEQADAEIEDRYLESAGPDVSGESAEDKQARLTQARNRAAEEVFAEPVTPSPASQVEQDPEDEVPRRSSPHEFVLPASLCRESQPAMSHRVGRTELGVSPYGQPVI